MPRNLYIVSTRPGGGKTTLALGILAALQSQEAGVGYFKPIGRRDIDRGAYHLDEDALLVAKACNVHASLQDANPVTLEPGQMQRRASAEEERRMVDAIQGAFARVAAERRFVVIEGFGHAAAGSSFGLSNARLARLLEAKVVVVAGPAGHPADDLTLNQAYLEKHQVELLGAIVNRVAPEKEEEVRHAVLPGIRELGIAPLGVLPAFPELEVPTMLEIRQATDAQVFSGRQSLSNRHRRVLVGAMTPQEAIGRMEEMEPANLLITSGDRTDLLLAAIICHQRRAAAGDRRGLVSGLVLTGGIPPHLSIRPLLRETDIPVLLVNDDSYTTASRVAEMRVRIDPADRAKVERIKEVVRKHVDIERLREGLEK